VNIPEISLLDFKKQGRLDLPVLACFIAKTLSAPPYSCKLTNFTLPTDDNEFRAIVDWMGRKSAHLLGKPFTRTSFTKVRINPPEFSRYRDVTGYSRTHLPIAAHTDSSYMPIPHQLVGFQCVIPAEKGGHNAIVQIGQVLDRLSPMSEALLRESVYPFGRSEHAIIGRGDVPDIRYYRGQLDHTLEKGAFLAPQYMGALEELDKVLEDEAQKCDIRLKPGEALVFNNSKAMHARSGFAENSDRLLIRLRQYVDFAAICRTGLPFKARFRHWMRQVAVIANKNSVTVADNKVAVTDKSLIVVSQTPQENYDHLLKLGADNLAEITSAAHLTLRIGRLSEAAALFEHAISLAPADRSFLFPLSAIRYYCGDKKAGEALLEKAARLSPFSNSFKNTGAPRLLRIRALKDIKYTLLKSKNGYKESFQRGHFSLQGLCDLRQFDTVTLSFFDGITKPELPDEVMPELFLNTVACGDLMGNSLKKLQQLIEKYPEIPVINEPINIFQASRQGNARRLNSIDGVTFPNTQAFLWGGGNIAAYLDQIEAAGFQYPYVLRPVGTHTGSGMIRVSCRAEAHKYIVAADTGTAYYAIQYHELADARGLYTKMRVFFIDGALYPVARLTHNDWNVHSGDRYTVMDKNPFMQEEEKRFLADINSFLGKDAVERLYAVSNKIKLDFFGIDFTLRPDGSLFIFECNAAMRHNFDHAGAFPYTRPTLRAVSHGFNTMVQKRLGIIDT